MAVPERVEDIETTVGQARAHFFPVRRGSPRATLVLGHGAGGGIEAWELQRLAAELPQVGVDVVLIEQPWRVAGKRVAEAQARVDAAFREAVTDLKRGGEALRRLIIGGRSTGARIACRTAADIGVDGLLCLAFPLHPPGRPNPDRSRELVSAAKHVPVTVIQGERDTFGTPVEIATVLAANNARALVVSVPWSDHSFQIPKRATVTRDEAGLVLTEAARQALLNRRGNEGPLLGR